MEVDFSLEITGFYMPGRYGLGRGKGFKPCHTPMLRACYKRELPRLLKAKGVKGRDVGTCCQG